MILRKNMKLGNKIYVTLILFFCFLPLSYAEEKITTSPLINVENIKPSFEELEDISEKNLLDLKKFFLGLKYFFFFYFVIYL